MKTSSNIGKILGIPIKLHFTFIIILVLFAWFFADQSTTILGFTIGFGEESISEIVKLILGIIVSILFFTCILLHELGHSYIAQKYGFDVKNITLFIFGGVSQMEEIPRDPKLEFRIAIIGPVISVLLSGLFYSFYIIFEYIGDNEVLDILLIISGTLAFYNFIMVLFNLIPAFPIDGGRVLRSYFARHMSYKKATKKASDIGKWIAISMAVFGIFYNLWLTFIGIFIYMGASQEEKGVEISIALEGIKVRDIMTENVISINPEMTLTELSEFMLKQRHMGYPVMENENLIGLITFSDVHEIGKDKQYALLVRDVMTKNVLTLSPDDDSIDAFKLMSKKNIGRLIVTENGNIVGIISRTDLLRTIKIKDM